VYINNQFPNKFITSTLLFAAISAVLSACGGGGSSDSGGQSLTMSTPFHSLTGLNADLSGDTTATTGSVTTTQRTWSNNSGDHAGLAYAKDTSRGTELLVFEIYDSKKTSSGGGNYYVGTAGSASASVCQLTVSAYTTIPKCATWGITLDRSGGTITFKDSPINDNNVNGIMKGVLNFKPF
jgi:hypothetical protein